MIATHDTHDVSVVRRNCNLNNDREYEANVSFSLASYLILKPIVCRTTNMNVISNYIAAFLRTL